MQSVRESAQETLVQETVAQDSEPVQSVQELML